MTHSWLSIHADYACRHSGACCTSGWTIPVEPELIPIIGPVVADGALPTTADGACVFFDRAAAENRCAIHRDLGVEALPVSCRHFPRVCLIDGRGVSVTLSHYCPTAVAMLFRRDRRLEVVVGPDPVPGGTIEGLDAREALPPLLSPSVLMDHDSYALFEKVVVAIFADDGLTAELALERVALVVERLRTWTPGDGPLGVNVAALGRDSGSWIFPDTDSAPSAANVVMFDEVRACVPSSHAWEPAPPAAAALWKQWISDGWPELARPVRNYLAAKTFASWVSYQGDGLRTIVRSLAAALSVVKVELIRGAIERATVVDEELLKGAFRRSDLLLVHLADREQLARSWSKVEGARKGHGPRGSW